ncbi:hypothetical protein ACIHFB_43975 [Streptomyces sp. NPDC051963]|uniref:hypothetical protein n=1 Tax=Streptomyces sp. NPDC051963 TaxID=3365678 RepID=UPI0037D32FCA
MLDPALQAVSELTATAAQFTESPDFYPFLRYRSSTLHLIAYDCPAREPDGGTRTWATLPRASAVTYGAKHP